MLKKFYTALKIYIQISSIHTTSWVKQSWTQVKRLTIQVRLYYNRSNLLINRYQLTLSQHMAPPCYGPVVNGQWAGPYLNLRITHFLLLSHPQFIILKSFPPPHTITAYVFNIIWNFLWLRLLTIHIDVAYSYVSQLYKWNESETLKCVYSALPSGRLLSSK